MTYSSKDVTLDIENLSNIEVPILLRNLGETISLKGIIISSLTLTNIIMYSL